MKRLVTKDCPRKRYVRSIKAAEGHIVPILKMAESELRSIRVYELEKGRDSHSLAVPICESQHRAGFAHLIVSGHMPLDKIHVRDCVIANEYDDVSSCISQAVIACLAGLQVLLVEAFETRVGMAPAQPRVKLFRGFVG